jgi:hypothetical protein
MEQFECILDTEEVEALPLTNIPVEDENQVHDGVHPCTDTTCPCQQYGYEVQA